MSRVVSSRPRSSSRFLPHFVTLADAQIGLFSLRSAVVNASAFMFGNSLVVAALDFNICQLLAANLSIC